MQKLRSTFNNQLHLCSLVTVAISVTSKPSRRLIHEARKILLETGKERVAKAKYAETAKEANDAAKDGTGRNE